MLAGTALGAIHSYATYVPRHRLQREELGAALGVPAGRGARVAASFDEDSTTMGLEAARRALSDGERPGSIHFATTSPGYLDKTNAGAIHAALDLGDEGFAVDLAGSARCGTGALRAAAASHGLAVLADVRTGRPGSADEREGLDGAAAFRFGDGSGAIAEVVAQASRTAEFLDRWRVPGAGGQSPVGGALRRRGLPAADPSGGGRRAGGGRRRAARPRGGLLSPLPGGSPGGGRASPAALPSPGRRWGTRAPPTPAWRWRGRWTGRARGRRSCWSAPPTVATPPCCAPPIGSPVGRQAEPLEAQLAGGRKVPYATYLTWRGLLEREPPRRPEPDRPAGPPAARAKEWKFAFVGSGCQACGFVHVPPSRVCKGCGAVDQMDRAPLAERQGTVATYTVDRLAHSPSPPVIDVVVDFDGGGRCTLELADARPDEVEIGMRVQMSFRRLYTAGDVHNYFWKARPTEV